ncbi:DUF3955 domain-containing protein [Sedimentitalea nanhaiensis]|uniref:DUF3955 domain-containing protein n=1 Tax=Sedimentitalea nanhaiensis TaxID=999627 RepID=UPI0009426269
MPWAGYAAQSSYVDENDILQEPFHLLALGWFFVLAGGVAEGCIDGRARCQNHRELEDPQMKTQLTQIGSSASRSVPLTSTGTRASSLSACGLLLSVGMLAGCSDPAPSGGISEPDPELVFVRGYPPAGGPFGVPVSGGALLPCAGLAR